jgi:hypothetical protein
MYGPVNGQFEHRRGVIFETYLEEEKMNDQMSVLEYIYIGHNTMVKIHGGFSEAGSTNGDMDQLIQFC